MADDNFPRLKKHYNEVLRAHPDGDQGTVVLGFLGDLARSVVDHPLSRDIGQVADAGVTKLSTTAPVAAAVSHPAAAVSRPTAAVSRPAAA